MDTGAGGYVLKSDAARELLPAVKAVLKGKRFVSATFVAAGLNVSPDPQIDGTTCDNATLIPIPNVGIAQRHEVGFLFE